MIPLPLLLRLLFGEAPLRALRRADRLATEGLALLRGVRDDIGDLPVLLERLDAVDRRLAAVERHVASVDGAVPGVARDVAALRAEAAELRELVPGDDEPGPLEKARQAITGE